MRARALALAAVVALLCLALPAHAVEDYATWAHSAKLKLNTTATGANVNIAVDEFPLLVRISDSRIISQSMATGADVRFADENGTHLEFQIERWDAKSGKAEFWVRVLRIDSLSDKQYVKVYWGKPGSAWLSDGAKVFTATAGYTEVYHLGEGGVQTRSNSAGNANHAIPKNYDGDERVTGVIGMADSLDGAAEGDYLDMGTGFADLGTFTYTSWAYPTGSQDYERFFDLGNGDANDNMLFSRHASGADLEFRVVGKNIYANPIAMPGFFDANKWMFVGVVVNGRTVTIFKNGVKVAGGTSDLAPARILRTRNYLGHSNWSADADFKGVIDEPQFSFFSHSPDWIKLSYESQRPDGKLTTWEFPPDVPLSIVTPPAGVTVNEGNPVKLTLVAGGTGPFTYQWSKDGIAVTGANGANLTIPSASLADAGVYTCQVSDGKIVIMSGGATVGINEDYSTWLHSQKIFLNTTATGANLSVDAQNFPLLLRLGKRSLDFNQVQAQGRDLRFSTSDGSSMTYAIERWDADTAEVWVRFNKVLHNDDKSYFIMYWGKAAAQARSNPKFVFAQSDGWRAYYGFNEAPLADKTVSAKDATPFGYTAAGTGVVTIADGAIGRGLAFAGSSHVEAPQVTTDGLKAFTIMAWAREKKTAHGINDTENPTVFGTLAGVPGQGDMGAYSREGAFGFWNGMNSKQTQTAFPTSLDLNNGAWHLVALTQTGNNFTAYGDGIALNSSPSESVPLAANVLGIGATREPNSAWQGGFNGDIDAVQILAEAKSPDWMKLAYFVQKPGSTVITFGAPADQTPPAPVIDPPSGEYDGPVLIQMTCATDSTRILYTLDGTTPDTVGGGSTRNISSNVKLTASGTVKAIAYRKGKSSAMASAVYLIGTAPTDAGDTLKPGTSKRVDSLRQVDYPNQDSKTPVLLTAGPAWNPLPRGFDKVGPRFTLVAADPAAAFPGLLLSGDSLAGLSLFRREANASLIWMPPKDGQLWIPDAGSYFWARDTLPPRIHWAGSSVRGSDSLQARIVIEDNVSGLRGKVRYWNGGQDSLDWSASTAGSTLEFTVPVPAKPDVPIEVRFSANDWTRQSQYPATGSLTLSRPLPAVSAPLALKPGIRWKMAGMPMLADETLTLSDLAGMSGTGPLYAAIWRSHAAPDTGYLILKDKDALPAGKGFWIAAEAGAPSLNFPASHTAASDSDGLFSIKLERGWNLVTCPSFRPLAWPVSVDDGEAYLRSPLKPLHAWGDTGYSRPDSLRPWEAYYAYYDKDTVVRVGAGAPRVADIYPVAKTATPAADVAAAGTATGSAGTGLDLGITSAAGMALRLGASPFARVGLGREDEARPPSVDNRGDAWLAREGRALAVDYVAWDPSHAMAWTLAARGQSAGSVFAVARASLPPGFEAWAVSPARRLKWRLGPGSNIPVTGDDTLSVYAGTPAALAKITDLRNGRAAAGVFAAHLLPAGGGLELRLDLPSSARIDVHLWSATGASLGGFTDRPFSAGSHALGWNLLSGGRGPLSQGAYWMEIHARGPDWTRRLVQSFPYVR